MVNKYFHQLGYNPCRSINLSSNHARARQVENRRYRSTACRRRGVHVDAPYMVNPTGWQQCHRSSKQIFHVLEWRRPFFLHFGIRNRPRPARQVRSRTIRNTVLARRLRILGKAHLPNLANVMAMAVYRASEQYSPFPHCNFPSTSRRIAAGCSHRRPDGKHSRMGVRGSRPSFHMRGSCTLVESLS